MAVKTFVPQLVRLLHHACNYITKRRPVLITVLTAPEIVALDAVSAACNAFTSLVTVPREEP